MEDGRGKRVFDMFFFFKFASFILCFSSLGVKIVFGFKLEKFFRFFLFYRLIVVFLSVVFGFCRFVSCS